MWRGDNKRELWQEQTRSIAHNQNMKLQPATVLLLTILLHPPAYGKKAGREARPISLDRLNLTTLKVSSEAKGLTRAFELIATGRKQCPQCAEPLVGAESLFGLVEKPFLIVDREQTGFGGAFLIIVFRSHSVVYRIWLYRIDIGQFQIREVSPLAIKLDRVMMEELSDKAYDPYWLNASRN